MSMGDGFLGLMAMVAIYLGALICGRKGVQPTLLTTRDEGLAFVFVNSVDWLDSQSED